MVETMNTSAMADHPLQALLATKNWPAIEQFFNQQSLKLDSAFECMAKGLLAFHYHKNVSLSLQYLENACRLSPKDSVVLNTFSDILVKTKRFSQAIDVAQTSFKIHPESTLSLHALAVALTAAGNYEQAFKLVKKGLALNALPVELQRSFKQLARTSHAIWRQPLVGKRLRLVRWQDCHYEFLWTTRQNAEFHHQYNFFKLVSEQAVKNEMQRSRKSPLETKKIEWVVEKDGQPIGLASFVEMDFKNRRAEWLLGFPGEKGPLDAIEAAVLMLDFAFNQIGLHKVYSYVYSDNHRGQENTQRLGFTFDGCLPEHVKIPGQEQWLGLNVNSMLASDFKNDSKLQKMIRRYVSARYAEEDNDQLKKLLFE